MIRGLFAVAVTLFLGVPAAYGQSDTALVLGTIKDSQGGVLPGVSVNVRNVDTGLSRTSVTDEGGTFRLPALPPGRYELSASLDGFAEFVRRGIGVAAGAEVVINIDLSLASVAEQVIVTADSPVVETTTAATQSRITSEALEVLPVAGRDYTSLLRLAPGAQSSNGFALAGSRGRSNQWTIDGADNRDDISGNGRQVVALEAVSEIQVLVNGFRAEFGQASGGVVNVVTRGGTNTIHGSLFTLFQDERLTARSPYADRSLAEDPFRRVYYGGTIGGPLRRDRTHYFATFEREQRDTFASSTVVLPSSGAAMAPGTLRYLSDAGIPLALFGTGGSARLVRPDFEANNKIAARVDHQFSASQFLTGRFTHGRDSSWSGTNDTLLDYNGRDITFRTNYGTASHKWILGSNKLNELFVQVGQTYALRVPDQSNLMNVNVNAGFSLGGPTNYPQGTTDYVFQLTEGFTWTRSGTRTGDHVIKVGGQVKTFRNNEFFDNQFRGIYTFPSLQAFVDGRPTRFNQNQGDSRVKSFNPQYALYVQDDWRPTPGLTLSLGLRYDYQGAKNVALKEITGEAGPGVSNDRNNVSPRIGVAWAPGNSTTQVLYGGAGLYYDAVILNAINNARFAPPRVIGVQIDNPAWPDPFLGGTVVIPPPNVNELDPRLRMAHNWNSQVGYRRELLPDLGLDVTFTYNRGFDHLAILNTNAGIPGTANLTGGGAVRPDPAIQNRSYYTNAGEIRYKGMVVDLRKRLSRAYQAGVMYTLSKTEDNSQAFTSAFLVPERMDLSYGPGVDDRRHRVVGHAELMLPLDVQIGVIMEYASEAPMDVTAGGRDLNGDGSTGDWVHEDICRNISCDGFAYSRNSVRQLSVDEANRLRALFGLSPITAFERNPRYVNADLTIQKSVRWGAQRLRVMLQVLNALNIPQRQQPQRNILSPLFGTYSAVQQPRSAQISLQYQF